MSVLSSFCIDKALGSRTSTYPVPCHLFALSIVSPYICTDHTRPGRSHSFPVSRHVLQFPHSKLISFSINPLLLFSRFRISLHTNTNDIPTCRHGPAATSLASNILLKLRSISPLYSWIRSKSTTTVPDVSRPSTMHRPPSPPFRLSHQNSVQAIRSLKLHRLLLLKPTSFMLPLLSQSPTLPKLSCGKHLPVSCSMKSRVAGINARLDSVAIARKYTT